MSWADRDCRPRTQEAGGGEWHHDNNEHKRRGAPAGRRPGRRAQGLRVGAGRPGSRPRHRAGRDRRVPRAQRGGQDHHHRHDPGPVPAQLRQRRRCSGCSPARPSTAGSSPPSCRPAACSRTSRSPRRSQYTASLFVDTKPVDEVLRAGGHRGIADRRVVKCSGGEQQRLRFAMALLPDPELLVLDEPTTGMDVEGRRGFWSAIRQDAAQGPDRAVRHPLPRGGRRLRRPDHPDAAGPGRRRRHRLGDQGAVGGPHRAGHAARRQRGRRCGRCPAWTASSCAATRS